jgi:hypothetical protein
MVNNEKNSMIKSIIGIIFIFFIFIAYSCSEKVSVDEKKESIDSSGERIIRIVFNFPGDDIGSPEHQDILHKIITSIKSKETGEILSSGFGMGNMEINIKIRGEESIKKIKRIISDNYPDANYNITKPLPHN